jgi:hypothetical protein
VNDMKNQAKSIAKRKKEWTYVHLGCEHA